ncbi:hypothetical protein CKM354_000381600 [Cercospora kikuchii]|uniref:BZIP domain-containing protein n=1 Tax=Cercospora kikuchii TaxID=84275 RepID=A0A9P3CCY2_9PEZI|nr:uncharacterized protein CKM354_000381600 [Cercospora kikuchii]GIZ40481.1 hypothetical protein CKM354_000381600 [Cercospora kikuchii]
MTSHPNVMYGEWSAEMPNDLLAEYHNTQVQGTMQPFWQWTYETTNYVPSEQSGSSSPEPHTTLDPNLYHEDFLDISQISTPMSAFDDTASETAQAGIVATGAGANKRMRRREQNRASQRAYRDRQRGKIAELQARVLALRAQNDKLQARNNMLEAAFQRDRSKHAGESSRQGST